MPDYSIPLQVQQPQPFAALNNVLGTMQGIQGLEQQNIGLQVQRQANQERKNFISLIQSDPTMRPGDDGTFDLGPANTAKILQAMPQTGADQIQKLADTNSKMTNARQAVFNLGADNAKAFGQAVNDLSGEPPSERVARLDELSDQFKGVKPFVDIYKHALGQVSNMQGPDADKATALNNLDQFWSRWHMGVQEQQTAGTPTLANVGGAALSIKPGVTGGPAPTGTSVPITLGPGEREIGAINPLTGGPFEWVKDANGKIVGVRGVGGGGTTTQPAAPKTATAGSTSLRSAPTFPTPQDIANANGAQTRWEQARQADSAPVTGYNATTQVYSNLRDLLEKNPSMGPGSQQWNKLIGALGTPFGGNINANHQEVGAYLDRLAAQNASAAGVHTDLGREQQISATGSPELNNQALTEKLRFGASMNEASHAYATASQAFIAKHGQNSYYNPGVFDSAWTKNADPLALRLMSAHATGDKADFDATLAKLNADPARKAQALTAYQNLKTLMSGDIPK